MLPEPALSFTIPSLHDGTNLDCRVYHPASLAATNIKAQPWRKHAAVVAHPYAPMGGCYDDTVLESVAARLLRAGYLVGTFNFRGAGHSAGRTSWTAKPERDDYASVVGFMAYYTHLLDPFAQTTSRLTLTHLEQDDGGVSGLTDQTMKEAPAIEPPVLLMGGYSYGAMITTQLPPLDDILAAFTSPDVDSNAAQIRLRAQHLAEQQNLILGSMRAAMLQARNQQSHKTHASGVRIGGDEGDRSPRKSYDSHGRRSFSLDAEDKIRRGVHEFMAKRKGKHGHHLHWGQRRSISASGLHLHDTRRSLERPSSESLRTLEKAEEAREEAEMKKVPVVENFVRPRPAYFLVSPLQGLVTHLATMSLFSWHKMHDEPAEMKMVENPTLAVFGDKDVFVPVGRLRTWVTRLSLRAGSRFMGCEVPRAGHFWTEEGVLHGMNERIDVFADGLVRE